ncbi:RNA polymerase sigma-70 factor (ECF subfamily) [Arthrobacter stackebrandtii]|uniref:RNA polymerase sigma-70 factor (ECF subfamily) n=1 Tax=Arthrobacter stackebrandtii TaxID=272161 RepID=A0ABS4Z0W1_9MICC|nr:zf-HC2 domain-containing protein [Arthrobacter stackebrandtii]MBP2414668.1 RNA polymerase sigma-70 factor (ECF subfamily) [Arthrobacter stackebrandtii]PYH01761.1 hypothetical protein CVV67_04730 [Arthrobacter stackebrandtii]
MSADLYALWDAAYVLGSLSAVQRREFEAHLSDCTACRQRVSELSGLPGLLALARDDSGVPALAPAGPQAAPLYGGLAAKVAARRRRWALAAAAAAVVLAGTTAGLTSVLGPGTAPPPLAATSAAAAGVPLTFSGAYAHGMTATGSLASQAWGTRIDWHCSYPAGTYSGGPAGSDFVLVMVSKSGAETTLASWTAGPGSEVSPTATTAAPVSAIARLDIRDGNGAVLLSAAP